MNKQTPKPENLRRPAALAVTAILTGLTGLTLTACGGDAAADPTPNEQAAEGGSPAARFHACLTTHAVSALLDGSGLVAVAYTGETEVPPGMFAAVSITGGTEEDLAAHPIGIWADDAGHRWAVPRTSAFFDPADPVGQAWIACEAEHPDFVNEEVQADPGVTHDWEQQLAASGLEFAQRAREAGFAWVADPEHPGAIILPETLSQDELISLLDDVLQPTDMIMFIGHGLGFDWMPLVQRHPNAASLAGVGGS